MTRFNPFDPEPTPSSPPYPDGWEDLIISAVLEDLSPEEAESLQQLLAAYPALQTEMSVYEEALNVLPYQLEPQRPSDRLEQRILQQAAELPRAQPLPQPLSPALVVPIQSGQPSQSNQSRVIRWPGRQVWQGIGAVAALLLIAFGLDNQRLRQQLSQATADNSELQQQVLTFQSALSDSQSQTLENEVILATLRDPNALVYSLQGTGDAPYASGRLLALPGQSEVVLVSHNLPILPERQIYRLWALETSAANPTYCGEFKSSDTGTTRWQIPEALCSNTPAQVVITIDQIDDPPIPKGPAVLQSAL